MLKGKLFFPPCSTFSIRNTSAGEHEGDVDMRWLKDQSGGLKKCFVRSCQKWPHEADYGLSTDVDQGKGVVRV